jgi:hypothetical protein
MDSAAHRLRVLLLWVLVAAGFTVPPGVRGEPGQADGRAAGESPQQNLSQSSLLNTSEGLTVIGAALETRGRSRSRLDCSHLVHVVYESAGFPYSYASSSDLYAGADDFQPVTRPQAGDLVVWPGHVGIVVNPSQSTFFSALRSGIGVDSYLSPYWKRRGAPRFYRYAKAMATRRAESKPAAPGLTPAVFDVRANIPTLPSVDVDPGDSKVPRTPIIDAARPGPGEVTQALLLSFSIPPETLRETDVLRLDRPLTVFSRLEVRMVKIHGDQGQAKVRITAPLLLARGQSNLKPRQQTETWPLRRRDPSSWELLLPQDTIYLSRDTAVRILAHQLARIADSENPSASLQQKSQLAKMLNALLTR